LIVIDNSALIEAMVGAGARSRAVARRIENERLVAPELIDVEAVSTIRGLVLGGKLSAVRGQAAIGALAGFPIQRVPHRGLVERMWELRDNLTAYDAAYVALAEQLSTSLVTGDGRLASAPRLRCAVEVIA
jgi:predicted nucleic acid-binding protein